MTSSSRAFLQGLLLIRLLARRASFGATRWQMLRNTA